MKIERYLMNPATGTVDTEENWTAEMSAWTFLDEDGDEVKSEEDFDELVEVVKDENGEWVEGTADGILLELTASESEEANPLAIKSKGRL